MTHTTTESINDIINPILAIFGLSEMECLGVAPTNPMEPYELRLFQIIKLKNTHDKNMRQAIGEAMQKFAEKLEASPWAKGKEDELTRAREIFFKRETELKRELSLLEKYKHHYELSYLQQHKTFPPREDEA